MNFTLVKNCHHIQYCSRLIDQGNALLRTRQWANQSINQSVDHRTKQVLRYSTASSRMEVCFFSLLQQFKTFLVWLSPHHTKFREGTSSILGKLSVHGYTTEIEAAINQSIIDRINETMSQSINRSNDERIGTNWTTRSTEFLVIKHRTFSSIHAGNQVQRSTAFTFNRKTNKFRVINNSKREKFCIPCTGRAKQTKNGRLLSHFKAEQSSEASLKLVYHTCCPSIRKDANAQGAVESISRCVLIPESRRRQIFSSCVSAGWRRRGIDVGSTLILLRRGTLHFNLLLEPFFGAHDFRLEVKGSALGLVIDFEQMLVVLLYFLRS